MSEKDYAVDLNELSKDYQSKEKVDQETEEMDGKLWEKLEAVGKKISFAKDIIALYRYLTDTKVQWYRKSIVVGALIYFLTPIDSIPDIAPLVGYLDDLGVITAVLKYLGHELMQYYYE